MLLLCVCWLLLVLYVVLVVNDGARCVVGVCVGCYVCYMLCWVLVMIVLVVKDVPTHAV